MALFRKRDVAVIAGILVTAYVTLDSNNFVYQFEPAWYVDQRNFRDPAPSTAFGRPILPIVTDLDGNGDTEIVLITKRNELKVCLNALSKALLICG